VPLRALAWPAFPDLEEAIPTIADELDADLGELLVVVGLGLLSTPISIDLAGTAAGVFKMSSMVGGAVGVARLLGLAATLIVVCVWSRQRRQCAPGEGEGN
jgi:hypothetical protein